MKKDVRDSSTTNDLERGEQKGELKRRILQRLMFIGEEAACRALSQISCRGATTSKVWRTPPTPASVCTSTAAGNSII